jgi:cytochrome b561
MKSDSRRYGAVAITMHWVTAIAILALLLLGFLASRTTDPAVEAALLKVHIPLGTLVLLLTLFRIGWWFFDRRPDQVAGTPNWQHVSERAVRILIYVLLLLMGTSGISLLILSGAAPILFFGAPGPLPDFSAFIPLTAHLVAAIGLLVLAGLHIAAALYHQLVKHDHLLARMGVGAP